MLIRVDRCPWRGGEWGSDPTKSHFGGGFGGIFGGGGFTIFETTSTSTSITTDKNSLTMLGETYYFEQETVAITTTTITIGVGWGGYGAGSGGGGGNLVPFTPSQKKTLLAKNPCQGLSPADLDYSVKRYYGSPPNFVEETAEAHIIRRHGSGPLLGHLPANAVSSTSYYISSPNTSGKQMFDNYIKMLNNATFNRPTEVYQLSNKDYLFIKDFPPIMVLPFPLGQAPRQFIGWDRATQGNTSKNNLIIKNDCKTVQTSYPGTF